MDEFLLPQRKLIQKKQNNLNKNENNSSILKIRKEISRNNSLQDSSSISSSFPLDLYSKGIFLDNYIQNYSSSSSYSSSYFNKKKNSQIISSENIPEISFLDLILNNSFHFYSYLLIKELFYLSLCNKSIYYYYYNLKFSYVIKLHSIINIIKYKNYSFGILNGCNISIGDVDEIVNSEDLNLLCEGLQNPKTQINCIIKSFAFQINQNVSEGLILDFIRALKYPSSLSLTSLSLEGSLMGEAGVMCLSNIFKKNYLPNLITLNINRNRGGYRGIHCLQQCLLTSPTPSPLLEQLLISDNQGELSILELLCSDILRTRPRLISLDLSHNSVSLIEHDAILLLQRKSYINLYTLQSLDLSFNPLNDDQTYTFFQLMWPTSSNSNLKSPSKSIKIKQRIHLKHLTVNHSSLGNRSFTYLGYLLKQNRFYQLYSLYLGMNDASGKIGIESILDALISYEQEEENEKIDNNNYNKNNHEEEEKEIEDNDWRKNFKILSIPMNPLSNEGLLALMAAGTSGAFKFLEVLDISDIGASTETIVLFLRNFIAYGKYSHLKKLIVFGRHPFAGKSARGHCTPEFLQSVKVS